MSNKDITTQVNEQTINTKPKKEKKASSFNWLGLTGVIIGAGALSLVAYLEFMNQQRFERAISSLAKQSHISEQYQIKLDVLSTQGNNINVLQATQQNNIATLLAQSKLNTQKIQMLPGAERQDWLMAEIEYLLRLANQRLLMEKDILGAQNLLLAADKVLLEINDPSLHGVRKIIADEVLSLRALGAADTEGVFLQIDSLQKQISQLDWIPQLPQKIAVANNEEVAEKSWWESSIDKLQNFVVFKHREDILEGPLSPQQHYYLQQNLRLMLEQSQLALLQSNQTLFDLSLTKAKEWITKYFQLHDSVTASMLTSITELQELDVEPELPSVTQSLTTLRKVLKSSNQQPVLSNEGSAQ